MELSLYATEGYYDEMFETDGQPRARGELLALKLQSLSDGELQRRQKAADLALLNMGITFNVYGHEAGHREDLALRHPAPHHGRPRVGVSSNEASSSGFARSTCSLTISTTTRRSSTTASCPSGWCNPASACSSPCQGLNPPRGVWCHITGTDLVRDRDGQMYVLEDNLRCPSGVSYVLENREVMKRTFSQMFEGLNILPVEDYPEQLLKTLLDIAPEGVRNPQRGGDDAGHLQLGLLRALLSGPADGRAVGAGLRPGGVGRLRLHAHHAAAWSGST